MFSAFYGLAPINEKILQERMKLKFMKPLTQSELKTLKEAEDILFDHVSINDVSVFDDVACALFKAIRKYERLEKRDETCQNG